MKHCDCVGINYNCKKIQTKHKKRIFMDCKISRFDSQKTLCCCFFAHLRHLRHPLTWHNWSTIVRFGIGSNIPLNFKMWNVIYLTLSCGAMIVHLHLECSGTTYGYPEEWNDPSRIPSSGISITTPSSDTQAVTQN